MSGWQALWQQLQQIINALIHFLKARRREEAPIAIAAILFWIGYHFINWFPSELQGFIKSWHGDSIIPGCLYIAGLIFLAMMIGVRNFATTTTGMWNNIAEEVTAH